MMIVLYSNHCPACNVLKAKLDNKKIDYTLVDDVNVLAEKGMDWLPILEVDGNQMRLGEANAYIESMEAQSK